jgi:Mg2+/citrate symporter
MLRTDNLLPIGMEVFAAPVIVTGTTAVNTTLDSKTTGVRVVVEVNGAYLRTATGVTSSNANIYMGVGTYDFGVIPGSVLSIAGKETTSVVTFTQHQF